MYFSSYSLKPELVSALKDLGYTEATPIQEATLSKALKGKSLICKSETGSGKTHAFLIPLFNNIDNSLNSIQAVIVSPTVDLASQTYAFAHAISQKTGISVKLITSNKDKNETISEIKYGSEQPRMIIGTPGRLCDILFDSKFTDHSHVKMFVLDECDMLLDESYVHDIARMLDELRPEQRLIFTATMKNHLIADTYKFVGAEEIIDIDSNKVNANVSHHCVNLKHQDELEALVNFLTTVNPYFTLVFASQKTQVEKIYKSLNVKGIPCGILNGDMESRDRKMMMRRIRQGDFRLVICSDIASRGIDLDNVSTVISYDLPSDLDYYYHRAGRAGRNGKKGDSYIFYNDDKMELLNKLIAKNKNISFDYYVLRKEGLKKVDTVTGKKKQERNEVLEASIKKEIARVRTKKVKPGYKKKVRDAVKKAKEEHKQKIIKTNLRRQRKENAEKGGYGSY